MIEEFLETTKLDNLENTILEIIKKENRKLNAIEIMRLIKDEFSAQELSQLIGKLEYMCKEGILKNTDGNSYKLNDLIVGKVDLHEKGNAHIIAEGYEDIFIPKNMMRGARNNDIVTVEYTSKEKNEGKVVKVLKRALGANIAEIIMDNGEATIKVYNEEELPYLIEVEETDLNLVDGMLVHLEYVRDIDKNRVLARIDRVLGHKNALLNEGQEPTEVSGEIVKIACEFGLRLEFPEEALQEAKNMPKSLSEEMIKEGLEKGREDFRNQIIFTIDGKDTKDIDDAIGLRILPNGNYELGVHIADVSHYVKPGSALWAEAMKRGNSNYLGNKVIPMLPIELSNGICSLNEEEDRFTLSCIMEIDHSGKVVNSRFTKGIIKSKKKMNYDAVQDIIEGKQTEETVGYDTLKYTIVENDTIDSIAFKYGITPEEIIKLNPNLTNDIVGKEIDVPCKNIIKSMYALSKKISNFKHLRGEVEFLSDEAKIKQDDNDQIIEITARPQRASERLIEDFMVVANEQEAEFLEEYLLATFRIHDKPLEKKMADYLKFLQTLGINYPHKIDASNISSKDCQQLLEFLKDEKSFKILNKKLLRSMQKAVYSTTNIGHFGIASPMYTHFTSPIRRCDDLLNHTTTSRILEDYELEEKFIKSWHAYLTVMCEYISECERNSEKCEYAVDDMLKAYYMKDHIGEEYDAVVDSILPNSFFVQTDNYIDGRVDVIEKNENDTVGLNAMYTYNENLMAYTKNGRVDLRLGDKVRVKCIGADFQKRQVDFSLIRKI